MRALWCHSVASAYATDTLASVANIKSDIAFLSGLLHDIGKSVLVGIIFEKYTGSVGRLVANTDILNDAIEPLAPLVGLQVGQQWKLSEDLLCAIFFAQNPLACIDPEMQNLARCVEIGSRVADNLGYGLHNAVSLSSINCDMAAQIEMNPEQFQVVLDDLASLLPSAVTAMSTN